MWNKKGHTVRNIVINGNPIFTYPIGTEKKSEQSSQSPLSRRASHGCTHPANQHLSVERIPTNIVSGKLGLEHHSEAKLNSEYPKKATVSTVIQILYGNHNRRGGKKGKQ